MGDGKSGELDVQVGKLYHDLVDKPRITLLKQLSDLGKRNRSEIELFLRHPIESARYGAAFALALSSAKSSRDRIKGIVSLATNDLSDARLTSYCVDIVKGLSYENKIAAEENIKLILHPRTSSQALWYVTNVGPRRPVDLDQLITCAVKQLFVRPEEYRVTAYDVLNKLQSYGMLPERKKLEKLVEKAIEGGFAGEEKMRAKKSVLDLLCGARASEFVKEIERTKQRMLLESSARQPLGLRQARKIPMC